MVHTIFVGGNGKCWSGRFGFSCGFSDEFGTDCATGCADCTGLWGDARFFAFLNSDLSAIEVVLTIGDDSRLWNQFYL